MNTFAELNLEEDMPTVNAAMCFLKRALDLHKSYHHECVLVIHGYGSSGKGGAICAQAHQWLRAQERKGKLKTVIFGENFSIFDSKSRELKKRFRELAPFADSYNHGVTIVEL